MSIALHSMVRVVLDSDRKRFAARVGSVVYLGNTHAKVRFEQDGEHDYWFALSDLEPAPDSRTPKGGGA